MQQDYRSILVSPKASIQDAIRIMDKGAAGLVLAIDEHGHLVGTVTDGDVRRGLLRGLQLQDQIELVMNRNPFTAPRSSLREDLLRIMRQHEIGHLPIVGEEGRVVGIELLRELIDRPTAHDNYVVIIAGGLGTRLRPLTEYVPKALLKIGDRSIMDVLVEQFSTYGFKNFLIAVNYRAELIEQHLNDGKHLGLNIQYLRESQPLGTVGAVRLAKSELTRPFFVVNGDLLTRVNFQHMLEFHRMENCDITVAVKEYEVRIPYGVLQLSNGAVCSVDEKPSKKCFVNAGIYVLNPSVVDLIPEMERYDMTNLMQQAMAENQKVGGFPIHEYWLDIGAREDYERAHKAYQEEFGKEQ